MRDAIKAGKSGVSGNAGTGKDEVRMGGMLEPGMLVRHPGREDWGLGQVQSVVGARVTVNFEHVGKVVIDSKRIDLIPDFGTPRP
jgi:hypothetical protein